MEGEEVIILMPDSTQKLTKRWTGTRCDTQEKIRKDI